MIFNTKTATSVQDYFHFFVNNNKFIPANTSTIANKEDKTEDENVEQQEGRTILYETFVVSTPVLASARIHQLEKDSAKNDKRLLDKSDVDELNKLLNSLYLDKNNNKNNNNNNNTQSKTSDGDVKLKEVISKTEPESTTTTTTSHPLGRCHLAVYSDKTKGFVGAVRSSRLAFIPQHSS